MSSVEGSKGSQLTPQLELATAGNPSFSPETNVTKESLLNRLTHSISFGRSRTNTSLGDAARNGGLVLEAQQGTAALPRREGNRKVKSGLGAPQRGPHLPETPKGWGVATAVAATVAVGGIAGYELSQSGGTDTTDRPNQTTNNPDRPSNQLPGGATITVENTPSATPTPTRTPETPTATPTPTETPTPVKTEVPKKSLAEQLPYEIKKESVVEYKGKYIDITFASANSKVNKISLSDETLQKYGQTLSYEELVEHLEDGILLGHLTLLKQSAKYTDWTLDDFKNYITRIKNGENVKRPTYRIAPGIAEGETSVGNGITIDALAPVYIIGRDTQGAVKLTAGMSFNYRQLQGNSLVLELYGADGFGINDTSGFNRDSRVIGIFISNAFSAPRFPVYYSSSNEGDPTEQTAREVEKLAMPIRSKLVPLNEPPNFAGIFKIR